MGRTSVGAVFVWIGSVLGVACGGDGARSSTSLPVDGVEYADVRLCGSAAGGPHPSVCLTASMAAEASATGGECKVIVAREVDGACACDPSAGVAPVSSSARAAADELLHAFASAGVTWSCACELPKLDVSSDACAALGEADRDGWCFTSAAVGEGPLAVCAQVGSPAQIRLVGRARVESSTCQGLRVVCPKAP